MNEKQLTTLVSERARASASTRQWRASQNTRAASYYHGRQWDRMEIMSDGQIRVRRMSSATARALHFTFNQSAKLVRQTAASTHPGSLESEWSPPPAHQGSDEMSLRDALEVAANVATDSCNLVRCAGKANHRRRMTGNYLLGYRLEPHGRHARVSAYISDPARLILDPYIEDPDLRGHDTVILREALIKPTLKRMFGPNFLAGKNLPKMAEIAKHEIAVATISNNEQYGYYADHSKSEAAVVYYVWHRSGQGKGDQNRYDKFYQLVEFNVSSDGRSDKNLVLYKPKDNADHENPYGGDGLPLVMLTCHERAAGIWSDGDIEILRRTQDRLNMIGTLEGRLIENSASRRWIVERGWMGRDADDLSIARRFTNEPEQIIIGEGSVGARQYNPPTLINTGSADAGLMGMSRDAMDVMMHEAHRAPGHSGITKSHVTSTSFDRALDEAEKVLDVQIERDIRLYSQLIATLTGTVLSMVKDDNDHPLRKRLMDGGVSKTGMELLLKADPYMLPGECRVRESNVRRRSHRSRREDLDIAVGTGAISPPEWGAALADDLDTPLTQFHRVVIMWAREHATLLLRGDEDYEFRPVPMPMAYAMTATREFSRAMMSEKAKADVDAYGRLRDAFEKQLTESAAAEQTASPEPPQPAPAPAEEVPMLPPDEQAAVEGLLLPTGE